MHQNRLRNIKSVLDMRSPPQYSHLQLPKKKNAKLLLNKYLEQQNENRILLKKMLSIDLKPSMLNPQKIVHLK